MSPPTNTTAILDTVLGHLARHFLVATNGDPVAARHAAACLLASYGTRTDAELELAADIVSFSFHALEALSESAAPDLSLNQKLRLRAGAVNLSREGHKARRKLDQVTTARAEASHAPPAVADLPPSPGSAVDARLSQDPAASITPEAAAKAPLSPEPPAGLEIPAARETTAPTPAADTPPSIQPPHQTPRDSGRGLPWTRSARQRHAAQIITENLRRNAAIAAQSAAVPPSTQPGPRQPDPPSA
ncbi:hypothetical protein [Rhodopila sp.]|uniref:hypothetical protein n=1 Tax=Rhodopila sp. TaxID=2480087 RepID=UPI003D141DEB